MTETPKYVVRKGFERTRYPTPITTTSMTAQSFRDECDINNIMENWSRTGHIDHLNLAKPEYGDFSKSVDYQEALRLVDQADASFALLDSEVRARFQNNPQDFMAFLDDPTNADEASTLGLVDTPPPDPTPEAAPPPAASPPAVEG